MIPARALAWLQEASPKEATTTESIGSPRSRCRRRARDRAQAVPIALGTCDAMVEVWGGTHSGRLPHTLWRPWLIGSSREAHRLSSVSNSGVEPGSWRARAIMKAPER